MVIIGKTTCTCTYWFNSMNYINITLVKYIIYYTGFISLLRCTSCQSQLQCWQLLHVATWYFWFLRNQPNTPNLLHAKLDNNNNNNHDIEWRCDDDDDDDHNDNNNNNSNNRVKILIIVLTTRKCCFHTSFCRDLDLWPFNPKLWSVHLCPAMHRSRQFGENVSNTLQDIVRTMFRDAHMDEWTNVLRTATLRKAEA